MDIVEFPNDRTVISTENNGFAGGERDENLINWRRYFRYCP